MTRTYSVFARVTTRHHRNQRASEHGRHTVIGRKYCRFVRNDTFTYSVAPLCRWVVSLSHRYELDTRTLAEVNGRPPIPFLAPRLDPSVTRSRAPSSHGHIVWYDRAVVADVGTVIMLKCSCAQFRSMSTRQKATWVETFFAVVRVKKTSFQRHLNQPPYRKHVNWLGSFWEGDLAHQPQEIHITWCPPSWSSRVRITFPSCT